MGMVQNRSGRMSPLCLILHLIIGSTLSGVFLTALLVAGWMAPLPILAAIIAGMVVAFPIARHLERVMR